MMLKDTHPAVRWVIVHPVGSRVTGFVLVTAVCWFWEGDISLGAAMAQAALGMVLAEAVIALVRRAMGGSWRPES